MRTKQSKLLITLGLALIITISLATQPAHAVVNKFKDDVGIGTTAPGVSLEVVGDIIATGTEWTERTPSSTAQWRFIAYGNGMFVAVPYGGTQPITSPDGINWTTRTVTTGSGWHGVCYGNGLFVAVAEEDGGTGVHVMTSPDGINWTNRTTSDKNLYSVAYGNGLFVAVGTDGSGTDNIMTSPDGINWTLRTGLASASWHSVTYGNGLFVAVDNMGSASYQVITSPDGINWTGRDAAAVQGWTSVTYGNGKFVAVSDSADTGSIMTSTNGTSWTSCSSIPDKYWDGVTYGEGLFVVVGDDGPDSGTGYLMTSPDGDTWTMRSVPAGGHEWYSVCYGNGMFVSGSNDSGTGTIMTSGRTKFNEIPTKNIYQGGMSIYGNVGIGTTIPSSAQLYVTGTCAGNATCDEDIAEIFSKLAEESLEPGDVVVLSGIDRLNLRKSQEPYDRRVAGVYSSDPGMLIKGKEGVVFAPETRESADYSETEIPLALAGKVTVKVTNENGPIAKGDLLTTSSTPGHAMKCPMQTKEDKLRSVGAVLGRALEPFDGEEGKIDVLVTLQ